ncbi:hypothetical protein PQR02_17870 [Paraburkholderia sediminicola]|uniref:Uncharacterized protein n=1 Tax=Paraburkholderia rhynchosiae TaxID=487049 RepID=A0ACC7N9G3_9BURK
MFNPSQIGTLAVSGDALPMCGDEPVLVALRLRGTEALGKLYEYRLDAATLVSPTLGLWHARERVVPDKLIGKMVTLSIEFEGNGFFVPGMSGGSGAGNVGAGTRTITGIITDVRLR